jgi:hypothetical protein
VKALSRINLATWSTFFLALLGAASPVNAERVCVHGHSASVEDQGTDYTKYGWGIRVYPVYLWSYGSSRYGQARRAGDWIHFSIPVDTEREYQQIRFKVRTSSTNGNNRSWIDDVHIYMGDYRVQTESGLTSWILDPKYLYVDLNQPTTFWNSIGVSVKLTTFDEGNWIEIASVCAFE